MPIQVERAIRAIKHELGQSLSNGITALEVVEEAYAALFSMKEGWFWAMRTVGVDTSAGSKFIRLPDDFGNMYRPMNGDYRLRIFPDIDFYGYVDQGIVQSAQTYICRLGESTTAEGVTSRFLEFVEPFEDVEVDKFRITYEAGPVEITDGEQTLPLPRYMHGLLLALCRAMAKGYEESDMATKEQRVMEIMHGPTYDHAVSMDLRMRPKRDRAIANRIRPIGAWPWDNTTAAVISPGGTEIWPS